MFKAITDKIKPIWQSKGSNDNFKNRLIKGAIGSFGLKIFSSALAFAMSVIFARFLGKSGLGTYGYATTWVNLLGIPAALGLNLLMVREIAVYQNKAQYGLMKGLLRWANLAVLIVSIAVGSIATVVAWGLKGDSDTTLFFAIALSMVTLPIISLRSLKLGAMKGLHKIVLGEMPDSVFAPIIIIILTVAAYFLLGDNFSVFWVLGVKIIASFITFIVGFYMAIKISSCSDKTGYPRISE